MTTPPPHLHSQAAAVSWHDEFTQFFDGIGLTETSKCFNAELIVLSRNHLERLPLELEKLVERLLQSLEQHVNVKEKEEEESNLAKNDNKTEPAQHSDEQESKLLFSKKRKRQDDDGSGTDERDEQDRIQQHMDSDQIQIRATNDEIQQRIQTFIQAKQAEVDASNRTEFLNRVDPTSADVTCARADAREINRNIQMKFDIVNNEDGPLARSLMSSHEHVQVSTAAAAAAGDQTAASDERIRNIEQHLNVTFDDHAIPPFSLHERIKILENTLMDIEREHPKWAAVHFQQPNRKFPPPPAATYIMRPDESKGQYVATQQPPQPPPTIPGYPSMKTTGRANSSLTRAVLEQLNRQRQQQSLSSSTAISPASPASPASLASLASASTSAPPAQASSSS